MLKKWEIVEAADKGVVLGSYYRQTWKPHTLA